MHVSMQMVMSVLLIMMDVHRCAQMCTNTAGSYQCSCDAGYTLNSDGHTCDGKTMLFILLIHSADYFQILMSVHWELTTVIKCVTTPLAPTIAAVILATIFSTHHTFAQV